MAISRGAFFKVGLKGIFGVMYFLKWSFNGHSRAARWLPPLTLLALENASFILAIQSNSIDRRPTRTRRAGTDQHVSVTLLMLSAVRLELSGREKFLPVDFKMFVMSYLYLFMP